jgi:hypothetical protein
VNPISAISWLWKSLRGHSVTFAMLIAFGLLGFSVIRWMKQGLDAVGTPWLAVFVLPGILIGMLAKHERVWIPDEARRKLWARSILGASVLVAVLMAFLRPEPVAPTASPDANAAGAAKDESESPVQKTVRPRGPSGK